MPLSWRLTKLPPRSVLQPGGDQELLVCSLLGQQLRPSSTACSDLQEGRGHAVCLTPLHTNHLFPRGLWQWKELLFPWVPDSSSSHCHPASKNGATSWSSCRVVGSSCHCCAPYRNSKSSMSSCGIREVKRATTAAMGTGDLHNVPATAALNSSTAGEMSGNQLLSCPPSLEREGGRAKDFGVPRIQGVALPRCPSLKVEHGKVKVRLSMV